MAATSRVRVPGPAVAPFSQPVYGGGVVGRAAVEKTERVADGRNL
jgi:hypothetical protein